MGILIDHLYSKFIFDNFWHYFLFSYSSQRILVQILFFLSLCFCSYLILGINRIQFCVHYLCGKHIFLNVWYCFRHFLDTWCWCVAFTVQKGNMEFSPTELVTMLDYKYLTHASQEAKRL